MSSDDLVADCTTETYAASAQPSKIKFIVWCGVRSGVVSFSVRRSKAERIQGFKPILRAWGRGAVVPFRCSRRDDAVRCVGRKDGPVKVQGWIAVKDERCSVGVNVDLGGGLYVGKPAGCPGTPRFWPRWNLRHLQSQRQEFGFDADLNGDQAAITRRLQGLIRAWKRGEPVARATAALWGDPMRARDQQEREYRSRYVAQLPEALNRWVPLFAEDTFAGYYVDHEHGGTVYIGFVGDQEARLAEFIASGEAIAPERLRPFPLPPNYSWAQLQALQRELERMVVSATGSDPWQLVNRIRVDIAFNTVEVHTEQVEEVRQLIYDRYGSAAPIAVVYGLPMPRRDGVRSKKTSALGRNRQGPTAGRDSWTHAFEGCAEATEIDYEAPLAELPSLPRNTAADGLSIGPPRLRLYPVGKTLAFGRSLVGYRLSVDRQAIHRPVFLNGYTELELDRVDREGRAIEAVAVRRQALGVVAGPAFSGRSFRVRVPAKPGLYRFQARLRDGQGGAVGRYADYLRVVRPVIDVRLVIGRGPIRPGSRLDFWIENRGTREVGPMGVGFAFEVFGGGSWSKAPGGPGVFPMVGLKPLSAGEAGACGSFQVPADAKPGLYRFSKDVVLESGARRRLTAKFEVGSR